MYAGYIRLLIKVLLPDIPVQGVYSNNNVVVATYPYIFDI